MLVGQAKNTDTPYSIVGGSAKESFPQRDGDRRVFERINRTDVVILIVGEHTCRATGRAHGESPHQASQRSLLHDQEAGREVLPRPSLDRDGLQLDVG